MSFFSFTKSENRRSEQIPPGGFGTSGREDEVGTGCEKVNILQILYTHVYK
jgi:hypothetical protein